MRGKKMVDRTSMEERRAAGLGDISSDDAEDRTEGPDSGDEASLIIKYIVFHTFVQIRGQFFLDIYIYNAPSQGESAAQPPRRGGWRGGRRGRGRRGWRGRGRGGRWGAGSTRTPAAEDSASADQEQAAPNDGTDTEPKAQKKPPGKRKSKL